MDQNRGDRYYTAVTTKTVVRETTPLPKLRPSDGEWISLPLSQLDELALRNKRTEQIRTNVSCARTCIIIINDTLARSLEPVVTECKEHTIHTQTQIVASRKPKEIKHTHEGEANFT